MFNLFKNKIIACIAGASFVLLSCILPARASDQMSDGNSTQMERSSGQYGTQEIAGRIDSLQSAKELIGANVKDNTDETIGKVRELILDRRHNDVSYVIIGSQGKLYAVPWSAFDANSNNIRLNIDKSKFVDAPYISSLDVEQINSIPYREKTNNFYSVSNSQPDNFQVEQRADTQEKRAGEKMNMAAGEKLDLYKYSELTGMKVQTQDGNDARLKNIVIDTHNGNIVYGLVRFGGFLGASEKIAAVPWASLKVEPQQKIVRLDSDRRMLEASLINSGNIDELAQPQFARNIHQNFGATPYWEVMGYVPPEAKTSQMSAWQPGSKYNLCFDSDTIKTIEGTIQSVDSFIPEGGTTAGLKLTVKTREGESVVVHGGPEQYALQREINFKPGMYITVNGSKTKIGDESVIMACEIKAGGKSLLLRDNQGQPKWNVGQTERQMKESQDSNTERVQQRKQNW